MIHLDSEGSVIDNQKINVNFPVTLTSDQGYFYVERSTFQAVNLNPDGTNKWNTTIPSANLRNLNTIKVIQTTDRGYVIVSHKSVSKDLSHP